ncbi:unnamed protein product [Aphanomyces euteiches]|uniref:RxLR effector protein n=1 Tax=Aphanomyces euteiches TaxID=100861 RepID=A0A6G0WA11_9STRA|nr:hypothetical protein Ae201684_017474 [Aphanomyces euteiches]KAH9085575.1 hypothetical protein Ae201684P_005281 [Aphanomyces euteiches]KAH9141472.1 hypothetical protein AeRB84_014344 [Aphanomyces euteiches]
MRSTSLLLVCLVLFTAVFASAGRHHQSNEVADASQYQQANELDGAQYRQTGARRQSFFKKAWKGIKKGAKKVGHAASKVGNAAMNALPAVQNAVYTGMQVVDTVNSFRGRGRYLRNDANDVE